MKYDLMGASNKTNARSRDYIDKNETKHPRIKKVTKNKKETGIRVYRKPITCYTR